MHSRYMEGLVRDVRPDVPLAVVPMGVPLPPFIPKEEARAYLGLDPDLFLVTSVGHLNPWKRVAVTLRAFKALLMDVPNALYLLVGSRSPNYDPTRQIEMLGLQDHVRTTGYVSQADFAYYLAASDVCLNLRYPTAGETSASLLRIMGAGVPVLVSRTGSFEELPDDAAGKINVGDIEEDLLLEYLLLLARKPDLRAAISAAARRYVAQEHTLEGAARGYLQFLVGLQGGDTEKVVVRESDTPHPNPSPTRGKGLKSGRLGTGISKIDGKRPRADRAADLSTVDPVGILAEAAAEVGIEESDDAVLRAMARAVEDLL